MANIVNATGPIKTPPSGYDNAAPIIAVDIYPHNGGKYTFVSSRGDTGILEAQIGKNIRDREGGKFALTIAPGGPQGTDSSDSWTTIINVNSLVVIYGTRGGSGRVLMLGVVTSIQEQQAWDNNRVSRIIKLAGLDFSYYFTVFSFYQLTYLGYVQAQFPGGGAGFMLGQFGRMIPGEPQQLASDYLNIVMLGVGDAKTPAVLENTFVTYNGNKILLKNIFSYWFEYMKESLDFNIFILLAMEISNSEGDWMNKFLSILPWPFYEFFVTTASADDYPQLGKFSGIPVSSAPSLAASVDFSKPATQSITPQQKFAISTTSVSPAIIGRINPIPWIQFNTTITKTGAAPPNSTGILHRERWDGLTTYSLGSFSFIDSSVGYSLDELANFFAVSTVVSDSIARNLNTSDPTMVAIEMFGAVISHNSINNFGFIPKFVNTIWWGGRTTPHKVNIDLVKLGQVLTGKLASYYLPTPYMLRAVVTIPMWLDVIPGTKFKYKPFKDSQDNWVFYIEGVSHTYLYGRMASTTLTLSRGLRESEYADNDTLKGLILDNYVRVDGKLVPRTDIDTNAGAYHVRVIDPNRSPYTSNPPNLGPGGGNIWSAANVNSIIPAGDGAGKTLAQAFKDAANACPDIQAAMNSNEGGASLSNVEPYKLLMALGMSESTPRLLQDSTNGTAVGIMQVKTDLHPEFDAAKLAEDPYYNIQSGGTVLCNFLQLYNLKDALAHYKGYPNGYIDPVPDYLGNLAKAQVDNVLETALVI